MWIICLQMIHMKCQDLFSSKRKELERRFMGYQCYVTTSIIFHFQDFTWSDSNLFLVISGYYKGEI